MASHNRHGAGERGIYGHHRPVRPLILEVRAKASHNDSYCHDRYHQLISLQHHLNFLFLIKDNCGRIALLQSFGYFLCLLFVSGKDQNGYRFLCYRSLYR
jgi:hypothetical protein